MNVTPTAVPTRPRPPGTTAAIHANLSGNASQRVYTCVPQKMEYLFAELIATSCSTPINLFLVTSLIVYREKLKSQLVNIYAANIVAAIAVSTVLRCFDTIWSYFGFGPPSYLSTGPPGDSPALLKLWTFQKTTVVTTYTVIAWGIFLVIFSIRSKAFRIHRTVAGVSDEENPNSSGTKQRPQKSGFAKCFCWSTKSRKMRIHIMLSWFVPIIFSLTEVALESCSRECKCTFNYIVQNDRVTTCNKGCSVVWAPITNRYLILGCIIWLICAVLLVSLLIVSQIQFTMVKKKMAASRIPTIQRRPTNEQQPTAFEIEQQRYDVNNGPRDNTLSHLTGKSSLRHSNFLLINALSQQLGWMRIISTVYVIGTGCIVGLTLYCIIEDDYNTFAFPGRGPVPIFLIPTLSETFAAVVLCTKLPNLRSAVYAMLSEKILFCTVVR